MIVIDSASPVPPFEQLRAQLARQIQDRTLAVGTRLPTIRRLAADLGLAVNTVGRAYRALEEAGLIETRIDGTARPRRLKPDAVEALWDWLGQYRALWEMQFQKMDAVLDGLSDDKPERSTS